MTSRIVAALVLASLARPVSAVTIGFEGIAPPGGLASPQPESGFNIAHCSIFDSAQTVKMIGGDGSDWAGLDPSRTNASPLTVTTLSGDPFTLIDLMLGPSTHPLPVVPVTFSLTGILAAGGTLNANLTNLMTAQVASLNWSGLSSLEIRAMSASILVSVDNINVVPIPEPAAVYLAVCGILALRAVARRR